MKKIYLLTFLAASLAFTACNKEKEVVGPTGAAGTNGIDGTNGTNGTDGTNGVDGLLKDGGITAKVKGTLRNGDPFETSLSFPYMTSLVESRINDEDGYNVFFTRRGLDGNSFMSFDFYTGSIEKGFDPSEVYLNFAFLNEIGDGKFLDFEFYDYNPKKAASLKYMGSSESTLSISNYSYDEKTGNLKFDYTLDIVASENSTDYDANVTGSVDVVLRKRVYKTASN